MLAKPTAPVLPAAAGARNGTIRGDIIQTSDASPLGRRIINVRGGRLRLKRRWRRKNILQ